MSNIDMTDYTDALETGRYPWAAAKLLIHILCDDCEQDETTEERNNAVSKNISFATIFK